MKKIINVTTQEEIQLGKGDLPMLIHGKERSGASFLSITIAARLFEVGNKILMFTAYPMAKEEFLTQVVHKKDQVFYLEEESDINRAGDFPCIIVKSGDQHLFTQVLQANDSKERIIFIKNVETILNKSIIELLPNNNFIFSGDITTSPLKSDLQGIEYKSRILFSKLEESDNTFPKLGVYQAFMSTASQKVVISLD